MRFFYLAFGLAFMWFISTGMFFTNLQNANTSVPSGTPTPTPTPTPTTTPTPAPIYYIDSVGGSDSNSGTDTSHPWQTLSKVQTAINAHPSPGTGYLFLKGDTWTVTSAIPALTLPSNTKGDSTHQITIGAYGTGANPIFDGNSLGTYCIYARLTNSTTSSLIAYVTVDSLECKNFTTGSIYFYNNHGGVGTGGMPGIVISNNLVHNNGPGAYPSDTRGWTSSSDQTCTATPPAGPRPCDDGSYTNGIMFLDGNRSTSGPGVQILHNTVYYLGPHNLIQTQGDSTQTAQVAFNTAYEWVHNAIDDKNSYGLIDHDNFVTTGTDSLLGTRGTAYYFQNLVSSAFPSAGLITWQNDIADDVPTAFECDQGSSSAAAPFVSRCNIWNNSSYSLNGSFIFSNRIDLTAPVKMNIDVRNNIEDTNAIFDACGTAGSPVIGDNSCGAIIAWDYNNDGALAGTVVSPPAGMGTHDQTNVDPKYTNVAANDLSLLTTSPELNAGDTTLTSTTSNPNIGAYSGSGTTPLTFTGQLGKSTSELGNLELGHP